MRELLEQPKLVSIATALSIGCGSLFLAGCTAPEGARSVGRVLSHDIQTTKGTTTHIFPNNRARIYPFDKKEIKSYILTVEDCGTSAPPPIEPTEGCTLRSYTDETLFSTYEDQDLVIIDQHHFRIVGKFAVPEPS